MTQALTTTLHNYWMNSNPAMLGVKSHHRSDSVDIVIYLHTVYSHTQLCFAQKKIIDLTVVVVVVAFVNHGAHLVSTLNVTILYLFYCISYIIIVLLMLSFSNDLSEHIPFVLVGDSCVL